MSGTCEDHTRDFREARWRPADDSEAAVEDCAELLSEDDSCRAPSGEGNFFLSIFPFELSGSPSRIAHALGSM